jgi:hypothetical protein
MESNSSSLSNRSDVTIKEQWSESVENYYRKSNCAGFGVKYDHMFAFARHYIFLW